MASGDPITLLLVSPRCHKAAGGWHQPNTSPLPTGHPIAPPWGSPLHRPCRAQGRHAVVLPSCVPHRRRTMPGTGLEQLLPPSFPSGCKNGARRQLQDSCCSTAPFSPMDVLTDQGMGSFSHPLK